MSHTRKPSRYHEGKNGFVEVLFPENQTFEGLDLDIALDKHCTAMYILTQKDRKVPSFQEMAEDIARPDDVASVREQLKALKEEHQEDLDRMYAAHAEEYFDEAMNRYLSKDDSLGLFGEKNLVLVNSYKKLDTLYIASRKQSAYQKVWGDDIERLRHTYTTRYLQLIKRLHELEKQEDQLRRKQDAEFPRSSREFGLKPKDIQLRVARFLLGDKMKEERMMSDYGWAWRQVEPLKAEFDTNSAFKAEVMGFMLSADTEVRDPRRPR